MSNLQAIEAQIPKFRQLAADIQSRHIYSNKTETSDFHGTVSFDLDKMFNKNKTKMFIKRRTHKNW